MVSGGTTVGVVTELRADIATAFGIKGRVGVAILSWSTLRSLSVTVPTLTPLPAFPAVEFDETIPLFRESFQKISKRLRAGEPLLKSVTPIQCYEREGKSNITLRFVYRHEQRTLTREEVERAHQAVLRSIETPGT